jgi:hypothetical protein
MAIALTLRKVLDRKVWEPVAPCPSTSAAGSILIDSPSDQEPNQYVLGLFSNTVAYLYAPREDGWVLLPSPALAGTFGAGVCGAWNPKGPTGTASAGSSTTITTTLTTVLCLAGYSIRLTGGTGAGQIRKISSNTIGANAVFTVAEAWTTTPDATTTYELRTGRFYVLGAGTLASGSFRYYDVATGAWTTLTQTGLSATWGTEGYLIAPRPVEEKVQATGTATAGTSSTITLSTATWTASAFVGFLVEITAGTGVGQIRPITANTDTQITVGFNWTTTPDTTSVFEVRRQGVAAGVATSATSTTLSNAGKSWTSSQWVNAQVRIVAGTGAGQVRAITANTSTQLTVATWTVTPDTTSVYVIEGNEDHLYLLGNNAVTLYRYSLSGAAWSTLSPGAARAGAAAAGCASAWVAEEEHPVWRDEANIQNGRWIYSFRGGGVTTLDRYDIALNTWTSALTYAPVAETVTTGTSACYRSGKWYVHKDATGRYFQFSPSAFRLDPLSTNVYPQGAALVGNRMFTATTRDGSTVLRWVYHQHNTSTLLWRSLDF